MANYKTQSMTLIPPEHGLSPRFDSTYGKSVSKELSPRKTVTYTTEKPRPLTRDTLYQTGSRQNSGYFDSMNTELNHKIEAIRKKYEEQRQQLMKSHAATKAVVDKPPQASIYVDLKPTYRMNASFSDRK